MKHLRKVLAIALALSLMLVCVSALATEQVKDGGKVGGTIIAQLSGDPSSWNPDYKSDDNLWPIAQNLFNRLIKLATGDGIDMDLAESYEFSEDGMQLTFHLHEGVKWHDGVDFTSYDVKWTYDTMKAEAWFKSSSLANVDSIECPDDNTVVFNLKAPDVTLIASLAWYGTFILPAHIFEGTDVSTNEAAMSHPIGTGPFKFESYETGVSVTLVRNEDFWGDKPLADKVIYQIVAYQDTAYQSFLNGEADYVKSVPTANVDDLDDDPDYRVFQQLYQNRTYITFNFADPEFSKVEVRQAFAKAVDREGLYKRVGGAGQMAEYFISPLQKDFVDETYKMPDRDLEGAMALLEAAGYTKGDDGFYLHATMDVFESGNFADMAQIIKANVAEAGIDLTINLLEYSAWSEKVKDNKNFTVTMLAGYQGPDPDAMSKRIGTGAVMNYARYSNTRVDELLAKARTLTTHEDRGACYREVQAILAEDLPIIPIVEFASYKATYTNIYGQPYIDGLTDVHDNNYSKADILE